MSDDNKDFIWRIELPSDGGPPHLTPGEPLEDVLPQVYMPLIAEALTIIGTQIFLGIIDGDLDNKDDSPDDDAIDWNLGTEFSLD